MIPIKAEVLDIGAVYEEAFSSFTKKVAAIELTEAEGGREAIKENYTFVIYTTGIFESAFKCEIENSLFDKIALNLNKGEALEEDMKLLYVAEYLNIVCGRALSTINGALKSVSRLTVPKCIGIEGENLKETYAHEKSISFTSDSGDMRIDLKYNYET